MVLTCAGVAPACDRPSPPEPFALGYETTPQPNPVFASDEGPVEPPYRETSVENGALVRGRVRFRGRVPYAAPLPVLRRNEICGTFKEAAPLRLNRTTRALSDAVVWLSGVEAGRPRLSRRHEIELKHCEFRSAVAVAVIGDSIEITSQDETLHALTARSATLASRRLFREPLPGPQATFDWTIEETGRVVMHCRAGHPWERLEIHRFAHPYATRTDNEGHFELVSVPAGSYELVAYHHGFPTDVSSSGRPELGEPLTTRQTVSLESGEELVVDLDLFAPVEARARR